LELSLNPARPISYRLGTLRWAVGVFYLVLGIAMLVSPHQFSSAAYVALQPRLPLWGCVFVLLGTCLVGVAVMRPPRLIEAIAHLLAGAGLIGLAIGFVPVRGWPGIISFGGLGLGTAMSAFMPESRDQRPIRQPIDLLPVVCGASAVVTGGTMLAFPGAFDQPLFDSFRKWMTPLALAFVVGGAAAILAQHGRVASRAAFVSAHLLLGGALLAFFVLSSLPLRAWLSRGSRTSS
jgi:hypothetical protein